jgi:hypothetical protein
VATVTTWFVSTAHSQFVTAGSHLFHLSAHDLAWVDCLPGLPCFFCFLSFLVGKFVFLAFCGWTAYQGCPGDKDEKHIDRHSIRLSMAFHKTFSQLSLSFCLTLPTPIALSVSHSPFPLSLSHTLTLSSYY